MTGLSQDKIEAAAARQLHADGLPQITMTISGRPISEFTRMDDEWLTLVMDQSYQRGDVWSDEQRLMLVKSLMMGLPMNAIYVNRRSESDANVYVIDGRQRLTTLRMFVSGELTFPAKWIPAAERAVAGDTLTFSQLSRRWQLKLRRSVVAVYETRLVSEAEEAELFLLLNHAGVPHARALET
jgi:hypothetical protein